LRLLRANLLENGQILVLANPSRRVHDQMARGKLLEDIGEEWVLVNPAEAVQRCQKLVAESQECSPVPELPQTTTLDAQAASPQDSSATHHSVLSARNSDAGADDNDDVMDKKE
jgi:hypothetical protein